MSEHLQNGLILTGMALAIDIWALWPIYKDKIKSFIRKVVFRWSALMR